MSANTLSEDGTRVMSGSTTPSSAIPFGEAFRVWMKIGLLSFGGPAGQIAMMHRILVEEKKWIDESRFLHALNYCMLLPGPEAQQLTVYVGWLLHGVRGGLVAGVLFVLPGALVIMVLSALYAGYGELAIVQAIFFGIKAAVLAVVIGAVRKLGSKVLKNGAMISIAICSFIAIFFLDLPFPLIVVAAAATGYIGGITRPQTFAVIGGHSTADEQKDSALQTPAPGGTGNAVLISLLLWLAPVITLAVLLGVGNVFTEIAVFFSKMAVVTFGGAYAVLAYMAQEAVETHGWLIPGEMLDGLGLAETTPGPLIMVTQFVGFLGAYRNPGVLDPMMAGLLGATLTIWVTFAPCFLWIFLGAPYVERLRKNIRLSAALSAVTAAVVGVVINLAVWFAINVVFGQVDKTTYGIVTLLKPQLDSLDPAALGLSIIACIAMLVMRMGMMTVLAGSAALGVAIQLFL